MSKFDIYSINQGDFFTQTRTVFLYGEINAAVAYDVGCRLKYLDYIDSEKPITIEINSPGGEVSSGLAIIDTINCIESPVKIVVCGMAASMAAVILSSGAKGKRICLPHSEVMIHQPLGGTQGQASDILLHARHIEKTRETLNKILAENTGKDVETITKDTDRDNFLDAKQAVKYGLVDKIFSKR